jgi:hypothetical protein
MSDFDKQEKRIAEVFDEDEVPWVGDDTLTTYLDYLKKNVKLPCRVTGIEDMGYFGWEEYYCFGPGSKIEYERLKKSRASFMDTFELLSFDDELYEEGILVNVKRVSDKKKFVIPLAELEAEDKKSKNYQLLDDYSVWFVNYGGG